MNEGTLAHKISGLITTLENKTDERSPQKSVKFMFITDIKFIFLIPKDYFTIPVGPLPYRDFRFGRLRPFTRTKCGYSLFSFVLNESFCS